MLRLTDDEAVIVVFPLGMHQRLALIRELQKLTSLPTEAAKQAFSELDCVMKGIQMVRNNVIHAVIMDGKTDQLFESRSKQRSLTKTQIFETEELTNYAGHAALLLRSELGDKDPIGAPPPFASETVNTAVSSVTDPGSEIFKSAFASLLPRSADAQHRRARRVLDLDPAPRPARAVGESRRFNTRPSSPIGSTPLI
jgi:hypothetical protein